MQLQRILFKPKITTHGPAAAIQTFRHQSIQVLHKEPHIIEEARIHPICLQTNKQRRRKLTSTWSVPSCRWTWSASVTCRASSCCPSVSGNGCSCACRDRRGCVSASETSTWTWTSSASCHGCDCGKSFNSYIFSLEIFFFFYRDTASRRASSGDFFF